MVARKKRGPGQPRKLTNKLGRWIDAQGLRRDAVAEKLEISVAFLNNLCRNNRRPSLELAAKIQRLTNGEVAAEWWLRVPPHSEA